MRVRQIRVGAVLVAICAAVIGVRGDYSYKPFYSLQAGFTQELFGVTESFLTKSGHLGGVAMLPNGDAMVAECVFTGTQLHRFNTNAHYVKNGSELHVESILPSGGGCGIVYHPDGTLYLNTKDSGPGITNVNRTTGAVIRRLGPQGNAVGIAVDPRTNHIVYTASSCEPNGACLLHDLDPVTGAVTSFVPQFTTDVGYVNGIYFDPTGEYLFLDNRNPINRLTVIDRAGAIVRHIDMPSAETEPVGIAFSATSPLFVVTNNTDGTMSRFDFPNDDLTQAPAVSVFASGGYRGDLMQVGPDGCLYATQGGARYRDKDEEKDNSIVRICGGPVQFEPPPGVPLYPAPQGTLSGVVTDGATSNPLAAATVLLSNGASMTTNAAGAYSFSLTPGSYGATASAVNYVTVSASNLSITNGNTTTRDFILMPVPGTLAGVVTNTAGSPIANATVLLTNGKSARTDSAGRYSITSVLPGIYGATVTATSYDALTATSIAIATNATTTANFTLTPTFGTLQGTVLNSVTGNGVPGATVRASSTLSQVTDANGKYSLALLPGTYTVSASATNFTTDTASGLTIANGIATTRNFSITPLTADIAVAATAPATVTAGNTLTYSFNATNKGTLAANGVVVRHVMPAQTVFTSVNAPSGWTCAKPAAGATGTISCSKPSMAVNESAAITLSVVVSCPFTGTSLTLLTAVTTTTAESNTANNNASAVTVVTSPVPVVSGAAVDKPELWPPNGKMVDVKVAYTVSRLSCATATTKLSVAGNDGMTADDFQIVDANRIRFRAKRSGNSASRVYTITIAVVADNQVLATKTLTVTVPHDQGKGK